MVILRLCGMVEVVMVVLEEVRGSGWKVYTLLLLWCCCLAMVVEAEKAERVKRDGDGCGDEMVSDGRSLGGERWDSSVIIIACVFWWS